MKTQETEFSTTLTVDQIKSALQRAIGRADVKPLAPGPGGGLLDGPRGDLELLVEKSGFGGVAAVQVLVFDEGDERQVKLIALGDGGLSRAFGGVKNTASLNKSASFAQEMAAALR